MNINIYKCQIKKIINYKLLFFIKYIYLITRNIEIVTFVLFCTIPRIITYSIITI